MKKKKNYNSLIIAGVVLVVIGIPFVLIIANRAMTVSKQKKLALEASEAALLEQEEAAKRAEQAGAGSENVPHEDASDREKASGTLEEQLTEEEKQALWVEDIAGSAFQKLIDAGVPMVFYDRICTGINASRVVVDDYMGAYNAVNHLKQKKGL